MNTERVSETEDVSEQFNFDCHRSVQSVGKEKKQLLPAKEQLLPANSSMNYQMKRKLVENVKSTTNSKKRPFKCDKCTASFAVKFCLHAHIRTHTGEKPYMCHTCGKQFVAKMNLDSHLPMHTTGGKRFHCTICSKSFKRNNDCVVHMKKLHAPFSCKECNKKFANERLLIQHQAKHTGVKPFSCEICSKAFALEVCFRRHLSKHELFAKAYLKTRDKMSADFEETQNVSNENASTSVDLDNCSEQTENSKELAGIHSQENLYVCSKCNSEFPDVLGFHQHVTSHVESERFVCDVCKKSCRDKYTLSRHMRIHAGTTEKSGTVSKDVKSHSTNNELYHCEICVKSFRSNVELEKHVGEMHEPSSRISDEFFLKRQLCYHNDHVGKDRTEEFVISLNDHVKKLNDEDTNYCKICRRQFATESDLKHHNVSNHNTRKTVQYTCKACERYFVKHECLAEHFMLNHINGNYLRCILCSKQFRSADVFYRHVVVSHGYKEIHYCVVCNGIFTAESDLRIHRTVHADVKPYVCGICSESFTLATDLNSHKAKYFEQNAKLLQPQFQKNLLVRTGKVDFHASSRQTDPAVTTSLPAVIFVRVVPDTEKVPSSTIHPVKNKLLILNKVSVATSLDAKHARMMNTMK